MDPSYQRALSPLRVAKMVKAFDPRLVGRLVVSRRRDGDLYIIDGQHRHAVVNACGVPFVLCLVYDELTLEDERWLFRELDTTQKGLTPFQVHHAGSAEAQEIDTILARYGLHLVEKNAARMWGNVAAVNAIYSIYRTRRVVRGAALVHLLQVLAASWHGEAAAMRVEVLNGLHLFLTRVQDLPMYSDDALIKVMQGVTPEQVIREARNMADALRYRVDSVVPLVLRNHYNKHRRASTRLPETTISLVHSSATVEQASA